MLFDLVAVEDSIKISLSSVDRKRGSDITLSIGLALDDMSMRLRSRSYLTNYEETISADAREATLRGDNDDLRAIFAIQMGSGVDQRMLRYVEEQQFLRDHNSATISASQPTIFTVLGSTEGFPTVRFNVPLQTAETLKAYHFLELSPQNISAARSISAVVSLSLGYFYGVGSEGGQAHYARGRELVVLSRSSDSFTPEATIPIKLSREDQTIRREINSLARQRR